jgi:hypothetical protein
MSADEAWLEKFIEKHYYGENQLALVDELKITSSDIDETYYSSKQAPSDLQPFIKYLSTCYYTQDPLISSWRWMPEWEESLKSPIVYYLVNLLIYNNTKYLPPDLLFWLKSFTRTYTDRNGTVLDLRKLYLTAAFENTNKNTSPLNNLILQLELPLADIINGVIPAQAKPFIHRTAECVVYDPADIKYTLTNLYGTSENIVIFSGIAEVICTNLQLGLFLNGNGPMLLPPRSWTLDLRVAVHFSQLRASSPEDVPGDQAGAIKVIFMLRTDKICNVSNLTSWEAEIFKPAGNYYYKDHFYTEYQEININSLANTKSVKPVELLVIVIEKIEPIALIKKDPELLADYLLSLYEDTGLADTDTQADIDVEEEDAETVKAHWDDIMEAFQALKEHKAESDREYYETHGGRGRGRKTRRRHQYNSNNKQKKRLTRRKRKLSMRKKGRQERKRTR